MKEISKENIDEKYKDYIRGRQYDDIDDTDEPRLVLNLILPFFLKVRKSNLTEIQKLKYIIISMQDQYNKRMSELCLEHQTINTEKPTK